MIYYDFKTQPFQTFEDIALSRATVFRWYAECKRGRESLKDEAHPGRPPTAVVPETVATVEKMLREDGRMTYSMLQDSLKIESAAVHTILHKKLQVRKVTARWIFPGENPTQKFRRSRSVGKKMVASFFSKTGHVATIQLEDCRTVNADWYVNHCIPQVLDAWRNKRPRTGLRGLLWHHDNASTHTAALTIDFLSENSIQLVTQPGIFTRFGTLRLLSLPNSKRKDSWNKV
eukprot:gene13448-14829_t